MDIDIRAHSRGRIYRNMLRIWLLMSVMTVGLGGLFVFLGLFSLLKDSMGAVQARCVAIPAGLVIAVAIDVGWQLYFLSQLSKSRLTLEGDTLLVRGVKWYWIVEKRYAIPDVAVVGLNTAKTPANGLVFVDGAGMRQVVKCAYFAFELGALKELIKELQLRGVRVQNQA